MRDAGKASPLEQQKHVVPTIRISAKIYGIMALTTASTFTALMIGYQLLFPPQQLFA
jgi:hypothetical protein